jgi:hypothetical protein
MPVHRRYFPTYILGLHLFKVIHNFHQIGIILVLLAINEIGNTRQQIKKKW